MKVLVCGCRDYGNTPEEHDEIYDTLEKLSRDWPKTAADKYGNWRPDITIISGGAKGADSVAVDWAIINGCDFKVYHADWKKYGKAAGPIRNKQMLDEESPDLIVAFSKDGNLAATKGTKNMVKQARERGIKTIVIGE